MGGRAIAKIINKEEAKRITKTEKENYIKKFISFLNHLFPVREILSKEDFGDIDFLYSGDLNVLEIEKLIKANFENYQGYSKNSNIYSYAINDQEIDIIHLEKENTETARHYFADNDKGNLIGVIYNRMGFIYGHEGLFLRMPFTKLLLSKDSGKIFKFLKFSEEVINKMINIGFKTYEEMFDTVISSPYFDFEYYAYENLNNENRTRNKKRKTYQMFLDYLKNKDKKSLPFTKEKMMYDALIFFDKEKEYIEVLREQENNKLRKTLINGDIIAKLTGFKNEELGKFIMFLKHNESFMFEQTYFFHPKEIENKIIETFKNYGK
jgi:hypothetical protein